MSYKNKGKRNAAIRAHRLADPQAARNRDAKQRDRLGATGRASWALKKRYGITLEQKLAIVHAQGGQCPICRRTLDLARPRAIHVDHDHATGRIRGVTCAGCNTALGRFGDTLAGALRAVEYLTDPNDLTTPTVDEHI